MGYNRDEFKEVKRIINSLKSQIDSDKYCEADNDDGKDTDSSRKEGNHKNKQRSNKGNTALTCKAGVMKDKIIDHKSS